MENSYQQRFDSSGRDGKLRKKGFTGALGASSQGTSSFEEGERKPKFHMSIRHLTGDVLDRFASIRIPGSKKDRPPLPHLKPSSSCDWSSSSSSAEFEELSSKITSEKEILALFEKMMEDMNLNEDKRAPLRQKDLSTKREMVLQYVVTASKAGSLRSRNQVSPQEFLGELKSGATDERLFACLDSLRVSLTSNPVR
ncbi:protein diaphanous homolog 3 isoform X3 [Hypomesus transpacificus]|uniref:protein diaphanous homolog 3 isoform X3 n=1 Tax=Hypomesus transpacificus TaxID=137520 RepID=UPI001F07FC46|nr:protein diaphanous homolog 3 isoform X3 [Hypomesus transpacificus]